MTEANPSANLSEALARFNVELPSDQVERIDVYCQLLWKVNESLNLTRHTDFDTFVARDVVDSVELSKLLSPDERVLDVGSGGGIPGILLAILRPDVNICLCECVQKKAHALSQILGELDLDVPVFADRSENVVEITQFNTLVARAVGPMAKILKWMENTWDCFDRLLLIKGPNWPNERNEARHRGLLKQLELRRVAEYDMPGTDSKSTVLMIWPKGRDLDYLPSEVEGSDS